MKVVSIQTAPVEGDRAGTLEKTEEAILSCRDADLVILPELWPLGFMDFDGYGDSAETDDGPTLTMLRRLARETGLFIHTGSLVEKKGGNLYNTSRLISSMGEVVAVYRKIHLFGYNSREKSILSPGQDIAVAETPWGTMGLATCFDLRFPELFRVMVDQGVEIFLVCAAWPLERLDAWQLLNRVRAMENQCFLVSANAAGESRGVAMAGHSMAVDPWGEVTALGDSRESLVRADLDTSLVGSARKAFPGLASRRQEFEIVWRDR